MNESYCFRCGRLIVFAKRYGDHQMMALEKIRPFKIDISAIGSTAIEVEPLDGDSLYVAHSKVCPKSDEKDATP